MRALLLALTASAAAAQSPLEFTIDDVASQWHWSGDTDLGPLEGNPSQDFALADTFHLVVTSGALPIEQGQFVSGGSASVVPDLSGKIPNPVPGFPPLAVIDITGLTLEFTTPPFAVAANGDFSSTVVVTALSGTLKVTPLVGNPSTTDLTGTAGDPTAFAGTITQAGTTLTVDAPQSSTFTFFDATSGITGTIDLVGDLVGHYGCLAPEGYCVAELNSSGQSAVFSWSGSTRIQDNALTLQVDQLPQDKFGYFLMSRTSDFVPGFGGSQGNLCLGSPQYRFNADILVSGAAGSVTFTPDMNALPQGQVFQPGDAWHFQLWYRDNNPGPTSNTSAGLRVVFCP